MNPSAIPAPVLDGDQQQERRLSNSVFRRKFLAPLSDPKSQIRLVELEPADSPDSTESIRCRVFAQALPNGDEYSVSVQRSFNVDEVGMFPPGFGWGDYEPTHCTPAPSDDKPLRENGALLGNSYCALSYFCGNPVLVERILLDEKPFWIGQNLFEALSILRYKLSKGGGPIYLWADAICIDQDDLSERSCQVTLMAEIYTYAEYVHIWLGSDGPSMEPLCSKLRQPYDYEGRLGLVPKEQMIPLTKDDFNGDNGFLEALLHLIDRPWYSRVWTQQEHALARTALCHLGKLTWRLECLAITFSRLWSSISGLLDGSRVQMILDVLKSRLETFKDCKFSSESYVQRFQDKRQALRVMTRIINTCDATNPRDRVYGLLGLLSPEIGIEPDYRASIVNVFEESSYKYMRWSQSLELLPLEQSRDEALGSELHNLPSWAKLGPRCSEVYYRPPHLTNVKPLIAKHRPGVLTVKCFKVGSVLCIIPLPKHIRQHQGLQASNEDDDFCCDARRLAGFVARKFVELSLPRRAPFGGFWRHMSPFFKPSGDPRKESSWPMVKSAAEAEEMARRGDHSECFGLGINERTFVTTGDLYGVISSTTWEFAPVTIKPGDEVVVLAGGHLNTVLRPIPGQSNGYTVVTWCVCNGIDEGEAIREAAREKTGNEDDHDSVFTEIDLY